MKRLARTGTRGEPMAIPSVWSQNVPWHINMYNFLQKKFLKLILTSHCRKDSSTFCGEIKKVSATNRLLISYDVSSLFTCIPLKETTDVAVNLLFEHNPGLNIAKAKLIKTCNIKYIFSFPRYILQSNRWCYHGLLS